MNLGSVAGTQHGLGLAVTVPVVGNNVLFVVLEVGHVGTPVNPPEFPSVQLIYLHDEVLAVEAGLLVRFVGPALVIELHQYLNLAVAIHVGTAHIVGNVGAGQTAMVGCNLEIFLRPRLHGVALSLCCSAHHGLHLIGARGRAAVIGIIRNRQGF